MAVIIVKPLSLNFARAVITLAKLVVEKPNMPK
jgi:hypothetical protein